ncbi:MAG: (2Fe-2S) ferredoxin domain-containing protein [Spirochaetaceae bacterium]|nr:(2Fe-2S) ferredoxin domain-containing protein [Spirochaetaceae bacterium]
MAKMTLEDLRKMRDEKRKILDRRDVSDKNFVVIVGMGTCGIAAGAKKIFNAFFDEIGKHKELGHVTVKQTGCMGFCNVEPTVDIKVAGMADTIYGKVDVEVVKRIVSDHIIQKKVVSDHVIDKPSIVKG